MQESFETINYQYPKPVNFEDNNSEFEVFKEISSIKCFAPEIKFLKNVRISTNSVVFNYFKIFAESCITSQNYEKYSKGFRFFLKYIFPKVNIRKKRFLLITDEYTSNYYHWHIFALKKLLILQQNDLIKDSLLFLPKKYQFYKFVFPSLKKFGIKKEQIIFLPRKSNIKVSNLPLIKVSSQHPAMFCKLREIITKDLEESSLDFGEKIYLSREGQALRFVENEEEVTKLLEKYGFRKIIAEKFSYNEQVALFTKVKYLVSPHGAGITNVLFMSKGSSLLEMATKQLPQDFNSLFYSLATMIGVKYFYQQCEIGEKSLVKDFHQGSLVVDLKKLEKNLQLMLQK